MACAPEAGCNFIQYKAHIKLTGKLPNPTQIMGRIEPHAAGPLNDGFQNNGRNFVVVPFKNGFKALDIRFIPWVVNPAHGSVCKIMLCKNAFKNPVHAVFRITHGHGAECVAMVS